MAQISVIGCGYVGLMTALVLARSHRVSIFDKNPKKIETLGRGRSPINTPGVEEFLRDESLNLEICKSEARAYCEAQYIFLALPTPEDDVGLDCQRLLVAVARAREVNPGAFVVIRSTVPIGFTGRLREQYSTNNILFLPEFLRERNALEDALCPSRLVVGEGGPVGDKIGRMFQVSVKNPDVGVFNMSPGEAEAVKLFSNAYLATRLAFFNELDSFCERVGYEASRVIRVVGEDPRIGKTYCNPSFAYGGSCLVKDLGALTACFSPNVSPLFEGVREANRRRILHIATQVLAHSPAVVGIYLAEGDDFKARSIWPARALLELLVEAEVKVLVYTEAIIGPSEGRLFERVDFLGVLAEFKERSELIVINRMVDALEDVRGRVYTRQI